MIRAIGPLFSSQSAQFELHDGRAVEMGACRSLSDSVVNLAGSGLRYRPISRQVAAFLFLKGGSHVNRALTRIIKL
jgi:hypothetical protein